MQALFLKLFNGVPVLMYKHTKTYVILLLFGILCIASIGAKEVTLDAAIALAYQNNLSLQANRVDLRGAQRTLDTAWNVFLPQISATLTQVEATGPFISSSSFVHSTNLGLSASLTLNPSIKELYEGAKLDYRVQRATLEQARSLLKRDVTKSFYYLLMEQENLLLLQANLDLAKKQYDEVVTRYEHSFASELEVLSAQLSYDSLKPAYSQSKNAYDAALLSFKLLLGLELEDELELQGEVPSSGFVLELEELSQYIGRNTNLNLLDLNLASLANSKNLQTKVALYPSLSVSGTYRATHTSPVFSMAPGLPAPKNWSDSTQLSVTIAIPLDGHVPGSQTKVALAKMQDAIDKLALTRQQTRKQLEQGLITRINALDAITEQAEVAHSSLMLTEKVYDMTVNQYESGFSTLLEVEKIQADLLKAKQSMLGLQYQYMTNLVDLLYDLNIDVDTLHKEP